jgi:hypothetical protein
MGAVRAFASAAAALGIWAAADREPAHAQDMMRGVDLEFPRHDDVRNVAG